jgi:hypothetical protein
VMPFQCGGRSPHCAGRCRRCAPWRLPRLGGQSLGLNRGPLPTCKEADVSNLFFDLAHTGDELSVKTSSGKAFSAPIGSDGSVETTFTLPIGAKSLSVDLTGNVKTREMEVFNKRYSCRFKLTPVQ